MRQFKVHPVLKIYETVYKEAETMWYRGEAESMWYRGYKYPTLFQQGKLRQEPATRWFD